MKIGYIIGFEGQYDREHQSSDMEQIVHRTIEAFP